VALSLVNAFWELLHDHPLTSSVIDPVAPPQNESLKRLQRRLAEDLLASDFDVARMMALMVTSPSFRRTVPEVLDGDQLLLAGEAEREAAMRQIGAFAGMLPRRRSFGMTQRLAFVLRAAGSNVDPIVTDSIAVLSQADESVSAKRSGKASQNGPPQPPNDFPIRGEALPVQWLAGIDNDDERLRHLVYLAGRTRVPPAVKQAAEAMRRQKVEDKLALQRIWWMLNN
jgi:hypothetical protein